MSIEFFKESNKFGFLSNFYKCKIIYDKKEYLTSEHLYQCFKYISYPNDYNDRIDNKCNIEYADLIRQTSTPYQSKILANKTITNNIDINKLIEKYNVNIRQDFHEIKEDIMYEVLKLKFNQNIKLKIKLINTYPNILIEKSPYDSYWGNAKNGLNKLGILLQKLRNEYIDEYLNKFDRLELSPIPKNFIATQQVGFKGVFSHSHIDIDLCSSSMQKSIRRGLLNDTLFWIYELFNSSSAVKTNLWNRLMVVAVEDIGLANPLAIIYAYYNFCYNKNNLNNVLSVGKYLCECSKSRINDWCLLLNYDNIDFGDSKEIFKTVLDNFKNYLIKKDVNKCFEIFYNIKSCSDSKSFIKQIWNIFLNLSNDSYNYISILKELAFDTNWKFNEKSNLLISHIINLWCYNEIPIISNKMYYKICVLKDDGKSLNGLTMNLELNNYNSNDINDIKNLKLGVPDFAIDLHTKLGKTKKYKRDISHFLIFGSKLNNISSKYNELENKYYLNILNQFIDFQDNFYELIT